MQWGKAATGLTRNGKEETLYVKPTVEARKNKMKKSQTERRNQFPMEKKVFDASGKRGIGTAINKKSGRRTCKKISHHGTKGITAGLGEEAGKRVRLLKGERTRRHMRQWGGEQTLKRRRGGGKIEPGDSDKSGSGKKKGRPEIRARVRRRGEVWKVPSRDLERDRGNREL